MKKLMAWIAVILLVYILVPETIVYGVIAGNVLVSGFIGFAFGLALLSSK